MNYALKEYTDRDYELIHTFKVPHIGWEMDNVGWVLEHVVTKERILLSTNNRKLTELKERDLQYQIKEIEEALASMQIALNLNREKL